jgi:hypothetical protein
MSERIEGVIVKLHADQPEDSSVKAHCGSYGLILGDDGKHYVFGAGQFYRNGSHIELGARYSFEVVNYSYAGSIDRLDKPRPT